MLSESTGEGVVHPELRRWRRGKSHETSKWDGMFAESGRIMSHISVNLVTANDGILSDVLSYIYPHFHSALVNFLLWLKFSFLLNLSNFSIMQEVSLLNYKHIFTSSSLNFLHFLSYLKSDSILRTLFPLQHSQTQITHSFPFHISQGRKMEQASIFPSFQCVFQIVFLHINFINKKEIFEFVDHDIQLYHLLPFLGSMIYSFSLNHIHWRLWYMAHCHPFHPSTYHQQPIERLALQYLAFLNFNNLHHFTVDTPIYGHILHPGYLTFWDLKFKHLYLGLQFPLLLDVWFSNSHFNLMGLFNSVFLCFLPISPLLTLHTFLASFLYLSINISCTASTTSWWMNFLGAQLSSLSTFFTTDCIE